MRIWILSFLFLLGTPSFKSFCLATDFGKNQNAVTYQLSGPTGRLGDNLIAYLHGKWISYKYHLPLLYLTFPYSDQLKLHENESWDYNKYNRKFKKTVMLKRESDVSTLAPNTLLSVPFYAHSPQEYERYKKTVEYLSIDWEDPLFKQEIRQSISPRFPMRLVDLSNVEGFPVALHVRKGGNFDRKTIHFVYPIKFPPDSFYISALETMSELLDHRKLYVYLFTDDLNPEKLVEKYKALTTHLNIQFDFKKRKISSETNVLEDFFSMMQFKGLIRAESHYSIVVEKLGEFQVVIHPERGHIHNKKVVIDQVNVINRL